ncbi:MAG TPA: hypothetical protein VIN73_11845 [Vicingaceae bacterium]
MKKIAITLFGISVFAGLGYVAFANTPLGKNTLTGWLLKKWKAAADKKQKKMDKEAIKKQLQKLKYSDLELLVAYTWIMPVLPDYGQQPDEKKEKRMKKFYQKINEKKIFQRADLSSLENIVFPG